MFDYRYNCGVRTWWNMSEIMIEMEKSKRAKKKKLGGWFDIQIPKAGTVSASNCS